MLLFLLDFSTQQVYIRIGIRHLSNREEVIIIEFNSGSPRVHFVASPALETLSAVGVLVDPSHHRFAQEWVAQLEANLDDADQSALALLRSVPQLIAFTDLILRRTPLITPEALAEEVACAPLDAMVYSFCNDLIPLEEIRSYLEDPDAGVEAVLKVTPEYMGGRRDSVRLLFADAARVREAYARLIRQVWELGVRPMSELERRWEECLSGLRQRFAATSARELASDLFGRPYARRYGPGHQFAEYWFVPSYFISPHTAVLFDPVTCVVAVDCRLGPYALRQERDRLSETLKAVADPTRLDILRLCHRARQYGQSLARQLKLKPATINHHLEILRSAGLLTEETEGSVKYLRLRPEGLDALAASLNRFVTEDL